MNNKKMLILFMVIFITVIAVTNLLAHSKKITCLDYADHPDCDITNAKIEMVNLLSNHQNTVIFGDSTAYSIHPEKLNSRVFNFQQSGQSPVQAYFLLRYMISQGKTPKNIVLKYVLSHYGRFPSSLYWDQMLNFTPKTITRADANEILAIDRKMPRHDIGRYEDSSTDHFTDHYEDSDTNNKTKDTVHIPYYYDIAFGPLMKIKADFNMYYTNFTKFYRAEDLLFKEQGGDVQDETPKPSNRPPICSEFKTNVAYTVLPTEEGVVPYYLKKLIELADKENIHVVMLGVHVAESCFKLAGAQIPNVDNIYLKQFKTVDFKYAGFISVPDELMIDEIHTNGMGANYYTQQVKPFFDEIQ